jgi:hypothetical protein
VVYQAHGKLGVPLHCVSDPKQEGGGVSAASASGVLPAWLRLFRSSVTAAGSIGCRWTVLD